MTEQLSGAISELSDLAMPMQSATSDVQQFGAESFETTDLETTDLDWSTDALDLLEKAETRAREGDWSGFGEALEELRLLLERLNRDDR
jgi:hypothetical protein